MSVGARVRYSAFWWLDRARGSRIRGEVEDIRERMADESRASDRLEALLEHAAETSPFYRTYAGGRLASFPIISKSTVRTHFDDLRSSAYAGAELKLVLTSGSTGVPTGVLQDAGKRRRAVADVIHFNEAAGLRLGDRLLWLRAWTSDTSRSRLARVLQNIIPIELVGMDRDAVNAVVRTLQQGGVDAILGYSAALWRLAQAIEDQGVGGDLGLRVVISSAEVLPAAAKQRMEAAFGCPVVDRYANSENGILACSLPHDGRSHVNRASYWFEFLRLDTDEPAGTGERARIVVTDLYSRAMPLVRYETGDLAIVGDVVDDEVRTLQAIEGRRADVLHTRAGVMISEATLDTILVPFDGIARYQLAQESTDDFVLRVVQGRERYTMEELTAWLGELLGTDVRVRVEFTADIPDQPNGKFRTLVNLTSATSPSSIDDAAGAATDKPR